jgi:hypothetical protein
LKMREVRYVDKSSTPPLAWPLKSAREHLPVQQ